MKKNYLGIIAVQLSLSLLLTGCKYTKSDQPIVSTPFLVKVQTVVAETVTDPRYYVGTIIESQSISLSFLTSGSVAQVFASEGERVKKSQVLAILHSENNQSILDASKAKEKQAQDAYDRFTSVYKNGSLPSVKMVEMETSLQQAKSSRQIAEKTFHDCTLYAPTDGVIGKRAIEPGMNVIPEAPVFTIVKIETVFAKVSVPESEIGNITIGQNATIQISALDNLIVNGNVTEKSVIADPLSRTYMIKITISNTQNTINPGMACTVQMNNSRTESRIVVPQYSVQSGTNEKYVFITDESKTRAVKRVVHVGSLSKNGVIILDGLHGEENLIVEGFQKLSDNSLITIK
jgi:membrane fusion protein, multidrug efflux system